MRTVLVRGLLLILAVFALMGLTACTSMQSPTGDRVNVNRVSSGQMIEVLDPASPTPLAIKVRLIGIDAPAWRQEPWFTQAHDALETFIDNKSVTLEFDAQPQVLTKAGNTLKLAYVWKDGLLLNEEMLKQGWGLASSIAPNTKYEQRLAQAQERARLLGLGIWNSENPMRVTPGEFRKQQNSAS